MRRKRAQGPWLQHCLPVVPWRQIWRSRVFYLFATPALLMLLALNLYPSLYAIQISFFDKQLGRPGAPFIGLSNYVRFLTEKRFWSSLQLTLKFAVGVAVVNLLVGFGLALLLNRRIRLRGLFRAIFLVPWVLSDPVAALLWRWMLDIKIGVINATLESVGLPTQRWLMHPVLVMAVLVGVVVWKGFGFQMLVMLASLQGIPPKTYEAAAIDGASSWQSFRFITIPFMRNLLLILFVLTVLGSIGSINIIIALTGGGPFRRTETIGLYMYNNAFSYLRVGYASAISLFFTIITLCILVPFLYFYMRRTGEES